MNVPAQANLTSHKHHSVYDFGQMAPDYDRWYETPEGREHDRVQKADVLRFLRQSPRGRLLLDVGAGTGHWSSFFAYAGYAVVGVDISEQMIRVANDRAVPCFFVVADACDLPFHDHSFEAAAAMASLEFISDVARALREMCRCVKPGGTVFVGTLNRLAPINRDRLDVGKQPYASARLLAPKELYDLLAPYGHVRMIASPTKLQAGNAESRHGSDVPGCVVEGSLTGPFIVAQVRTT